MYQDAPKPLYVKSHTKIKVLVVCSSALRCLEVFKELVHSKIKIAKLFAKHKKVDQQVQELLQTPFLVGVGTPARLLKIMQTDPGTL